MSRNLMKRIILTGLFLLVVSGSQQIQAQDCNTATARAGQMKSQIENLNERIARHQQAIKNLNLDMRAEEVNEWVKLSEEAQNEARSYLMSAVLSSHPVLDLLRWSVIANVLLPLDLQS